MSEKNKQTLTGFVKSDKMNKTVVVEVSRRVRESRKANPAGASNLFFRRQGMVLPATCRPAPNPTLLRTNGCLRLC